MFYRHGDLETPCEYCSSDDGTENKFGTKKGDKGYGKVGVIGAGSWGIALAKLLRTNGNEVTVWSIVEEEVAMLRREHEHIDKLPGVSFRRMSCLQQI